eukprot:SAG31_NODE_2301_length_5978_cov_14.073652_5_plen_75_part_00
MITAILLRLTMRILTKCVADCMPYPREYLASTLHPNVVTIRASHDYKAGSSQWKISRSSLVAHAVGLLPFKDTL